MYVPRDDVDYYMQTGTLPKTLAANAAYADLQGIRVPTRQDDGSYKDARGDVMMREDMADYFARLRAAHAPLLQLLLLLHLHLLSLLLLKNLLLILVLFVLVLQHLLKLRDKDNYHLSKEK